MIKTPDTTSDLFTLYYQNQSDIKNCAEGSLLITKGTAFSSTISSLSLNWGDKDSSFTDYSAISTFTNMNSSDFQYDFTINTLIPMKATKIWVEAFDLSKASLGKASVGVEDYKENQNLLYEFQVISDNQVTTSSPAFYNRSKKTFEDIKKNSPRSSGIIVNGDIVDEYSSANYDSFFDSHTSVYGTDDYLLHIGLGNHEFIVQSETDYDTADEQTEKKRYEERLALWENKTGNTSPYFYEVINGSYFIYLGTTKMPQTLDGNGRADCVLGEKQLTWLEETVKKAGETGNPIYLFSHGSLRDTVSGSLTSLKQTWYGYSLEEETKIRNIIKDYKQLMFFSSHSHWCFESKDPYKISDNYPSFFNTAAIGYLWEGEGGGHSYMNGSYDNGGAQGLYVEVYDSQVVIKGRQFEASDKTSQYWFTGYQVVLPY